MAEIKLSEKERITLLMIRGFGDRQRSYNQVQLIFNETFNDRTPISKSTVERTIRRFSDTGSVRDNSRSGRPKSTITPEKTEEVLLTYVETPRTSTRRAAQLTGIDDRSVRRILKAHNYFPYKCHSVQELLEGDLEKRMRYCDQVRMKIDEQPDFLTKLVFSDEATFYLNGAVNKHNDRLWTDENPYWIRETHTQTPQKVNVWCGMVGDNIIGPFFIQGNLNGERYLELLQTEIVPAIQNLFPGEEFGEVWFQQDGAPPHYSVIVRDYLNVTFPNRWIGRGVVGVLAIAWPPRSPDLTPLDFFLWGYLKDRVYKVMPANVEELKQSIRNEIQLIPVEMIRNAIEAAYVRMGICEVEGGSHFEHLLK